MSGCYHSSMLTKRQNKLYQKFYQSTHENEYLDTRTEILVGLSAAIAMDCAPCMRYYLQIAEDNGVSDEEVAEVLAKVMAVAAGQKRLQTTEAARRIRQ